MDSTRLAGVARTDSTRLPGVLMALLSAASLRVMPVLNKVVYRDGVGTLGVLSVRFTLAGVLLGWQPRCRTRPTSWPRGERGRPVRQRRGGDGRVCRGVRRRRAGRPGRLPTPGERLAALVAVALVGTVVAVTASFAALERLGPADTAVVSTVEPVVSVLVAAAVLGERLSGLQVAGGALVLLAVLALARLAPLQQAAAVRT